MHNSDMQDFSEKATHMKKRGSKTTLFKPGQSGNPAGRPPRYLSKKEWMEKNITEEMRIELLQRAYELALSAHKGTSLIEFFLARMLPPAVLDDAVDISFRGKSHKEKADEIFAALEEKRITPAQSHILFATLCDNVKLVEMTEIVERIKKLEESQLNTN